MHCWAHYLLWLVIAVLGIGNLLTACGQKGDLYLPEPQQDQTENYSKQPANPPLRE